MTRYTSIIRKVVLTMITLLTIGVGEMWGITVTYRIINLGRLDDNGAITTSRTLALEVSSSNATVGLPAEYKSPLAKNWQYYAASDVSYNTSTKVCTFSSGPSLTEGVSTASDGDVIYVTYEINEEALTTVINDGDEVNIKLYGVDLYHVQDTWQSNVNTDFYASTNTTYLPEGRYSLKALWHFNIVDPYQITIQTKSSSYPDYYLAAGNNFGDIRMYDTLSKAKGTGKKVWAFAILPGGNTGTYRLIVTDGCVNTGNNTDSKGHGYLNNANGHSRYHSYYSNGSTHYNCDMELLPLTRNYTYHIVDKSGNIAIQYTVSNQEVGEALSDYTDIPEAIRSPYLSGETVTFYSFDGDYSANNLTDENKVTATPRLLDNIYVTYTTDHLMEKFLHLRGVRPFNIKINDKYVYDSGTAGSGVLSTESTLSTDNNHLWYINNNDPYAVTLKNDATQNYLGYTTPSTVSLETSPANKCFILMGNTRGNGVTHEQLELMAATGGSEYYRVGLSDDAVNISTTATGDASVQIQAYPFSITSHYYLIDKSRKLIAGPLVSTSAELYLPDEWRSPLVSAYHYYKTSGYNTETQTYTPSDAIESPIDADGPDYNIYVTYDVNDAIDLEGGKAYLMKFSGGEKFNQEDGLDGVMTETRKAIYPYNNGDFNLYVYGQERWEDQLADGASTRSRWLWYIISNQNGTDLTDDAVDPYHVRIKSYQNQSLKINGVSYPGSAYLRTYQPDGYGSVVTGVAYVNSTYPNSKPSIAPTEYMILGTSIDNMTLKTVGEIGGSRQTVTSFEQYWKNNPTVNTILGTTGSDNLTSDQIATLIAKGWHSYSAWANAAPWDSSTKSLSEGTHWFQTVSMDTGDFTLIETELDPVLILLDQHGWEIVRIKLPHGPDDPDRDARYEALHKYSSPMVKTYHYYKTAVKVGGYHKYDVDKTSYATYSDTDLREYTSTTLGSKYDLPNYATQALDAKNNERDWYVTYDVIEDYANSYIGAATEDATSASTFLIKQGGKYASSNGSTTINNVDAPETYEDIPNAMLWYLKPNFNIDVEMGYKYAGETGAQADAESKTDMEAAYYTNGQNGFDPYNMQIENKVYPLRYFTANTSSSALSSGIWTGTSSAVTLENLNIKQTATGHDQAHLQITNATFMVVDDGNGNMRLMPRFDNSKVATSFSTLSTQLEAAEVGDDGTGTQTFITEIIANQTEIHSSSEITAMNGNYLLASDFTFAEGFESLGTAEAPFTGKIDGQLYTLNSPGVPIIKYARNATIKNVILDLDTVTIGSGNTEGHAGAIVCTATGSTRIYNCGVLAGTVSGSGHVGSILGHLEGNTRVINCFSFATVNGGTWGGGIVGYNSTATTQDNVATSGMVMNCMFYGEVASGSEGISPVFGGANISNNNSDPNGKALNTFNYFRYMADYCQNGNITAYNCALGAKEIHLKRFEFYRNLLNSNRELAAWYATGSVDNADTKMAKWVYDKSAADYPILKVQGTYPSVINYDPEYTYDLTDHHKILRSSVPEVNHNQGRKLGTLQVNISDGNNGPSNATIVASSLTLPILDKDTANYNFNYYKVQLPYYNEVGRYNYTENKVVTGWKVTVSGGSTSYNTASLDASIDGNGVITTPYNFADRKSTEKDNFDNSGRIFPQGGYFNVPEGVSSISIEPYWGTAVYLSDPNYDKVANKSYGLADVTAMGARPTSITIDESEQTVYTSISGALGALTSTTCAPYDQAIVLVGNYHIFELSALPFGNTKPCTIMSIDQNGDNEPDCSMMIAFQERRECPPIRFDFLNFVPFGIAQKVFADAAPQMPNIAIFKPKGWFEVTTTCITEMTEFEYEFNSKTEAPLIFLGGHIGQIVSQNSGNYDAYRTTYIHLGDNVYFDNFCNGIHSDKKYKTRHCPISVTGGEYENFYLSGLYKPGINPYDDGAECYINGGRFGEVAGAAHEKIAKDVYWLIDHADIDDFYGGGINADNPILGNINVTINNSNVGLYCGGPKFGDMSEGKTVTTSATGTTFGRFFGAGYGGTSLNRVILNTGYQSETYNWSTWVGSYTRKYVDNVKVNNVTTTVNAISTSYETEFFAWAGGTTKSNVGRFYVNFASLSLANTRDVTSTLTDCTIETNFYGGGNLGAVTGNVNSTLTNTKVKGNAFGAGFSAAAPTVDVYPTTGFVKVPSYNSKVGIFNEPTYPTAVTYTWSNTGSTSEPFTKNGDNHWIYTDVDLKNLGAVTGNDTLIINGKSVIGTENVDSLGNVYGGGEESDVVRSDDNGNTTVIIGGKAKILGNVFAAGKGLSTDSIAAHVGGNSTVIVQDSAEVIKNVYGGGEMASVGNASETPDGSGHYSTGLATVTIKGNASLGTDENCKGEHGKGYVYGSGLGKAGKPGFAFVKNTIVTIGGTDEGDDPTVRGSVFGSGEDGHVRHDTQVYVKSGTVGTPLTEAEHLEVNGEGDSLIYRGNVYGGGRGVDLYQIGDSTLYSTTAGIVYGNATVNISGGKIYHDVYGAGSMASVGTITDTNNDGKKDFLTDNFTAGTGVTTVNISGGQIGETGFNDGRVYGAGRGASGKRDSQVAHMEFVDSAKVNITGGKISGCVFGGGENGHVKKDAKVFISGGIIGTELSADSAKFEKDGTGPIIYRGNVYGGGRGVDHISELGDTLSYTAGRVYGNTEVSISGGIIRNSVYGGGSLASVGTYAVEKDSITSLISGGVATVKISGGHIGNLKDDGSNSNNPGKNNGNVFGSCRGMAAAATEAQYSKMAFADSTSVIISGSADIRGSVFGGGENGHVLHNTNVEIKGGTIGEQFTAAEMEINDTTGVNKSGYPLYRGNVYGGGRGVDKAVDDNAHLSATAGRVYGNTYVTVSDSAFIRHNVFGGGSLASVGIFDNNKYKEYHLTETVWKDSTGITHVTIKGGTIGQSGTNNGHVFGSGRGMAAKAEDTHQYAQMAFVDSTNVIINGGTIKGSVFGSGENGHVHTKALVTVNGGTIGSDSCSRFAGNVYGGGRGVDEAADRKMSSTAGWVGKTARVTINGGTIYHDVYGGGSMGSVGVSDEGDTGQTYVLINGATIGVPAEAAKGYGNVYGGGRGMAGTKYADLAFVKNTEVTIQNDTTAKDTAHVLGNVYGGGNAGHVRRNTHVILTSGKVDGNVYGGGAGSIASSTAGLVHHDVLVDMNGGIVGKNVYGGGAIANTNTHDRRLAGNDTLACNKDNQKYCTTIVNLKGGLIKGDAYGGGEGMYWEPTAENASIYMKNGKTDSLFNQKLWTDSAKVVYAKHAAIVYGDVTVTLNGTAFALTTEKDGNNNDVPNSGRIFGCNNINGTPKGTVMVHVLKTVALDSIGAVKSKPTKGTNTYELEAVYGGGNLAGYQPYTTLLGTNNKPDTVLIEGCDETSIKYVYGGGSAADVPATNVIVKGTYEVYQAFGGGNGMEMIKPDGTTWRDNYGADVGAYWYDRTNMGTGNTNITVEGGTIHQVFGGSNTLGTIYGQTTLNVGQVGDCPLCVDDIFNGGNKADTNGGTVVLGCTDYMKRLYAGANAANVNGNVELTITSGRFDQVFAGNNASGVIKGSVKINIEETGCNPIIIGELYGGGNNAPYSVYGYKKVNNKLVPRSSMTDNIADADGVTPEEGAKQRYANPELNIKSFTSIGRVFGGGRGVDAVVYGSPVVNINEVKGLHNTSTTFRTGEDIANYLGDGKIISVLNKDSNGQLIQANDTINMPTHTSGTIGGIGYVYGGGNAADIYGSTTVNICTRDSITFNTPEKKVVGNDSVATTVAERTFKVLGADIRRNVFGGGKGSADSFECDKAYVHDSTSVTIGNGTVGGSVYGGGEVGRVENNATVTIGLGDGNSAPVITGNVFGAGKGVHTHGYSALVRGNTSVIVQDSAKVGLGVYGGGEIASVGKYNIADSAYHSAHPEVEVGMPYSLVSDNRGICNVIVRGNAEIGPNDMKMPEDKGHVFGAGKGVIPYEGYKDNEYPWRIKPGNGKEEYTDTTKYLKYVETLGLATQTNVTIGGNAFVKGSVYGGAENGFVQHDTHVTIQDSCQIGNGEGKNRRYTSEEWTNENPTDFAECASWPYGKVVNGRTYYYTHDKYATDGMYSNNTSAEGGNNEGSDGHTFYGNVFGGGSGYDPYKPGKWHRAAGSIGGNTRVDITGGHILTSVYGGNEMTDVMGSCTVNMSGGTLGVPRTYAQIIAHPVTCYMFGAGKGDQRIFFNQWTNVDSATVNITGGRIFGSVFGGGEDGHVLKAVTMNISGATTKIGTLGYSYVDGNIFGSGRGFAGDALTAGTVGGNVNMTITGGQMLGSIYGGGRLASVGTHFVQPEHDNYGKMQDGDNHGVITINISGGIIGNNAEYIYNPDSAARARIPLTTFAILDGHQHLMHTKGGNVFAGGMGRMTKLDGTLNNLWSGLAKAKRTYLTVSDSARIKSNVYGGAEFGAVTENTEVIINGGVIGTPITQGTDTLYTYGSVYGSGYGSDSIRTNMNDADPMKLAGIVQGNTRVTVNDGIVYHNVYGGGELASVGTFTQYTDSIPTACADTTGNTRVVITGGTIGLTGHEDGMVYGSGRGDIHENGEYDKLAWVDSTMVIIGTKGNADGPQINGSVYGSGENGHTLKNTDVTIHSGVIGIDNPKDVDGGARYLYRGNVYGGGCGTDTYKVTEDNVAKTYYNRLSGVVRGNTNVTIDGGKVVRCVYGGGAMGSVGSYFYNDKGKPDSCVANTGLCTILIKGGEIGPNGMKMLYDVVDGKRPQPYDAGHVFGAGRGEVHDTLSYPNLQKVVYVNATDVTIDSVAYVKGSVYGGAESGHVLDSTYVKIRGNCQIGQGEGKTGMYTAQQWKDEKASDFEECAHWPYTAGVYTVYDPFVTSVTTDANGYQTAGKYEDNSDANGGVLVPRNGQTFYGCVFAGGCGYYPYAAGKWLDSAGLVEGNAKLEMTGGHVLTNVYGGNEMTDVLGSSTVTITGGTVGVPRTVDDMKNHPVTCYVFGGGRGDQRTWFNTKTNIHENATLTVTGTARVFGSVYGGGEDGHVFGDTQTTLGNTTVKVADKDSTFNEAAVTIGTLGTSGVDGNVFGSGRGFTVTAYTAGSIGGNATVNINEGTTILGSVYGGGRMASVGSWFVNPDDTRYGTLQPDTTTTNPQKLHGHITININGGTIGATDSNGNLVNSEFSIGDVFGGCKGSKNAGEHANKFGIAKYTNIIMTNGTVNGSIYGGGEAGHVQQDTNINITDADNDGNTIVKGNVYGGGSEANVGGNTNVVVGQ